MIGIVNIGGGNLGSISQAIYCLGYDYKIIQSPEDFINIDRVILPGVGSYDATMKYLDQNEITACIKKAAYSGIPILGICVGMQILSDFGEEGGGANGLGLIPGVVRKIKTNSNLPLPHIGWNDVVQRVNHPLFRNIKSGIDFYFVNSYFFLPESDLDVVAETEYGVKFCSAIACKNIFGVQFHPEKSQRNGLRLLENFCEL